MDKIEKYRNHIKTIIKEQAALRASDKVIETQTIIDTKNDHYQLYAVGWEESHRIHGCVFHLDIKDGKIWVQYDGTEPGIANELLALGIPKEDIVLAFHAPYKRPYTGFAVA